MDNCDTDWDEQIDSGPGPADADLMDEERVEMVRCPHCGEMVSEFDQQCPYCKYWIIDSGQANILRGRSWWWIALALGGMIMFVLLYIL